MNRKINLLLFPLLLSIIFFKGCILEEFDTIPLNIPIEVPFILVDDLGVFSSLSSEAPFCIDTNQIFTDYREKVKRLSLVEVAIRFTEAVPAGLTGNMKFILRQQNSSGEIIINQNITSFNPTTHLVPNAPFIMDLTEAELELMEGFLAANGTCFYGEVVLDNLSPADSQKRLTGYVDMLFKADVNF